MSKQISFSEDSNQNKQQKKLRKIIFIEAYFKNKKTFVVEMAQFLNLSECSIFFLNF